VSSGQRGNTQDDITSKTTKFAQAQKQVPHAGIKRKFLKYYFYMAEKGEVQLLDLCAYLASSSVDFSVSSASPALGYQTFLQPRRPRQVARPPFGSVVVLVRSLDLPPASSSSSGCSTSFRLRHRRLRLVVRPSSNSVVVCVRSLDLPPASSSSLSGRSTSLWLRRRLCQVARPPSDFIVTFVRSFDLPLAPSSPSPAKDLSSTFLLLRRHLRQRKTSQ
jgi:hypothetical protein